MNIQYVISHSLFLFFCRQLRFSLCRKLLLFLRFLLSCWSSGAILWRSVVKHFYAPVSKVKSRILSLLGKHLVRIELMGFFELWIHLYQSKGLNTKTCNNCMDHSSLLLLLILLQKPHILHNNSMSAQSGGYCLDLSSLLLDRPWL